MSRIRDISRTLILLSYGSIHRALVVSLIIIMSPQIVKSHRCGTFAEVDRCRVSFATQRVLNIKSVLQGATTIRAN